MNAPTGTLIAHAMEPGAVAVDGDGRNSPYTAALAEVMTRSGLALEAVFREVRVAVMRRTGNQQVPWEESSLTGAFHFVP